MKLALSLLFGAILTTTALSQQILNGSVAIPSGNIWYVNFYVPPQGGTVVGRFQAQGGNSNDIEAYIVTPDDYVNMANGHAFRSYYSSGTTTLANVSTELPNGYYRFAFSNRSGWVARTIYGNISLITNTPRREERQQAEEEYSQCQLVGPARVPLYIYDKGGPNLYLKRGSEIERHRQRTPGGKRGTLVSITAGGRPYWVALKHTRCSS